MTHSFKLSRRVARLRGPVFAALLVALVGCDSTESLTPENSLDPGVVDESLPLEEGSPIDEGALIDEEAPPAGGGEAVVAVDAADASATFSGGIPMGLFHLPSEQYGSTYNGALRVIWPQYLMGHLAAIKARGGKVVLSLNGNDKYAKDASGRFSLSKWKARIDRYRGVNFSQYINDGTIIGHFLLDEPNDKTNWNGTLVSPATVEEMARYSKQLWPGMATIIRAEPAYMLKWSGSYRYLDAAWAQYVTWKGTPDDYLRRNVADATKKGLALIVGLNVRKGGPNLRALTPTEVKTYGTKMLNSSYPCAFISWEYTSSLISSSSMKSAMDLLRSKARNRSTKTCRS